VRSYQDLVARRKYPAPEIEVCEPQVRSDTIGKHHEFKVKGHDHQGEFEVYRRFKFFDAFRKCLHTRFLGLYVPPIPEKKAVGNTDRLFVEERMVYLNKFMKDCAAIPYIAESQELQTFLRPPIPDIE
jgi:sorting nexin-1/2